MWPETCRTELKILTNEKVVCCWLFRSECVNLGSEAEGYVDCQCSENLLQEVEKFYVYGSVHHNIFYEIRNRCSYMQSILFHC